jgi:hypothetical protein
MAPFIETSAASENNISPRERPVIEPFAHHVPNNAREAEIDNDSIDVTPIAIIGMSMKFPGGSSSADMFWSMLEEGRNASREFPPDRLNGPALYHPDSTRTSTVCSLLHCYCP